MFLWGQCWYKITKYFKDSFGKSWVKWYNGHGTRNCWELLEEVNHGNWRRLTGLFPLWIPDGPSIGSYLVSPIHLCREEKRWTKCHWSSLSHHIVQGTSWGSSGASIARAQGEEDTRLQPGSVQDRAPGAKAVSSSPAFHTVRAPMVAVWCSA